MTKIKLFCCVNLHKIRRNEEKSDKRNISFPSCIQPDQTCMSTTNMSFFKFYFSAPVSDFLPPNFQHFQQHQQQHIHNDPNSSVVSWFKQFSTKQGRKKELAKTFYLFQFCASLLSQFKLFLMLFIKLKIPIPT